MKIKSCEIKSFGKLKDRTINLDDKITVIRGNNESGKSTLSAFIKYVLYGYTGKGKDERGNEKLHYSPWSGEKSAGALVLSSENGEVYRAERSGDGKSGSAKLLSASGSECFEGYSAGEALFGIDAQTFAKSAFVGQTDIEAGGMKDIGASLEKILLENDGDADYDKAVKSLEAERNTLYNRMRKTGKLFELSERLNGLYTLREQEAENHKSLLTSRFSAAETEKRVNENSVQLEALYAESENIAAYDAEERLVMIHKAQEKCKMCENALEDVKATAMCGDFLPDRKYLDELQKTFSEYLSASPELARAENELAEAENRLTLSLARLHSGNNFGDALSESADCVNKALCKASQYDAKRRKFLKFGILFTCLIVTIPVAVVMFVLSAKNKKQLKELLEECGFATLPELEKFEAESKTILSEAELLKKEIARRKKRCDEKKIECSVCEEMLYEKLGEIGYVCACSSLYDAKSDISDNLLPKLREHISALEAAQGEFSREKTALDALLSVSDLEKLTLAASKKQDTPPKRSHEAVDREIKYIEGANSLLAKKLSELRAEIARLEAVNSAPEALEAQISETEKMLSDSKLSCSAMELALELIEKSRNDIRKGVLPKISERAGELFSKFTGGKYRGLFFDSDFGVSVLEESDTETRRVGFLSAGAVDAAYIALRIALAESLCREKPIFIFDDSFVKADNERLENILSVLLSLSEEYQIIILSCHTREEQFLSGKCKLVVLDE